MATKKPHPPAPIGADDLVEYLDTESDFSFELATLKLLRGQGLDCDHGGLYEDPVTKKSRQFDIRASARAGDNCVRLAIECKNVRAHYPLLVSCIPRHAAESFHEFAIVGDLRHPFATVELAARTPPAVTVRVGEDMSIYKPKHPVGKALAQVGRKEGGEISASDQQVYDKWFQCLASADELVTTSWNLASGESGETACVAVIPILVVPNERLWAANFDADGKRVSKPTQVDRCTLFVNNAYQMDLQGPTLTLSHIEILTSAGLRDFVHKYLRGAPFFEEIFPRLEVQAARKEAAEGR